MPVQPMAPVSVPRLVRFFGPDLVSLDISHSASVTNALRSQATAHRISNPEVLAPGIVGSILDAKVGGIDGSFNVFSGARPQFIERLNAFIAS